LETKLFLSIEENEMNCPVCENQNAVPLPKLGDFDDYHCETCDQYRISGTVSALRKWDDLGRTGRLQLLFEAKREAEPGRLPMITVYTDHSKLF
jgi:hypothetical protein